MPSYRSKPAAKNPADGAKHKTPMHKMGKDGQMMPDKDMASHPMPKPKPTKKGR